MSIYIFMYSGAIISRTFYDYFLYCMTNIRVGQVSWGYFKEHSIIFLFLIPNTLAQLSYCSFRKPKKEKIYQAAHSLTHHIIF